MKKTRKKQSRTALVLNIVSCVLAAVSAGLSVAAFVISLTKKNSAEK